MQLTPAQSEAGHIGQAWVIVQRLQIKLNRHQQTSLLLDMPTVVSQYGGRGESSNLERNLVRSVVVEDLLLSDGETGHKMDERWSPVFNEAGIRTR